MGTIQISRDSGYADRMRQYKVMCNGQAVGKIGNGETKEFNLAAGEYEIYLKIDWCRSNKVTVVVDSPKVIKLAAGSSLRGMKIFLAIFYITIMSSKYLWLKLEQS